MDFTNPNDFSSFLTAAGQGVGGGLTAQQGLAQAMPAISAHQNQAGALQNLALLRIQQGGDRQKIMNDFNNQMQQWGLQANQPTQFDYAGAGIGGLNALGGIINRDNGFAALGVKRKGLFQQIFGDV